MNSNLITPILYHWFHFVLNFNFVFFEYIIADFEIIISKWLWCNKTKCRIACHMEIEWVWHRGKWRHTDTNKFPFFRCRGEILKWRCGTDSVKNIPRKKAVRTHHICKSLNNSSIFIHLTKLVHDKIVVIPGNENVRVPIFASKPIMIVQWFWRPIKVVQQMIRDHCFRVWISINIFL